MTTTGSERPSEPRIHPVGDDSEVLGRRFGKGRVQPINVSRTIARHSGVFEPWSQLARYLAMDGTLPAREREIVVLRVGWRARSVYEFGQHTLFGRRAGLTDEEISAVTREVGAGPWTDDEKDLIGMVDELIEDDCVGDATWARLARRWSSEELIELVLLAGFYRMVSSTLNTLGVQLEEGVPGWPS